MNIIINGTIKKFDKKMTINEVLDKLSLTKKVMAAAVNMEIVKQNEWQSFYLNDNDKLELLDFVGGG